jgi:flagellar protein FlaG
MELDVTKMTAFSPVREYKNQSGDKNNSNRKSSAADTKTRTEAQQLIEVQHQDTYTKERIELYLKKLFKNHTPLNKKLKFYVNKELNQVVVKVIDSTTDKVIKEIPPEEIQKLHIRIREAIGLLIDEEI